MHLRARPQESGAGGACTPHFSPDCLLLPRFLTRTFFLSPRGPDIRRVPLPCGSLGASMASIGLLTAWPWGWGHLCKCHRVYSRKCALDAKPHRVYGRKCALDAKPHRVYGRECTLDAKPHRVYGRECTLDAKPHRVYGRKCALDAKCHRVYSRECALDAKPHRVYSRKCALDVLLRCWLLGRSASITFTEKTAATGAAATGAAALWPMPPCPCSGRCA